MNLSKLETSLLKISLVEINSRISTQYKAYEISRLADAKRLLHLYILYYTQERVTRSKRKTQVIRVMSTYLLAIEGFKHQHQQGPSHDHL